jgi:surfactin synthase thioesterase subunit
MPEPGSRIDPWLRRVRSAEGVRCRLICFPHAGGTASYFSHIVRALPEFVEALAVQYPGRQERYAEKCVDNLDELADGIFGSLCDLRDLSDIPCVLFGHSMGSIVAYEVARRLERSDSGPPLGLIVSGRRAPSISRDENMRLLDDAGLVAAILKLGGTDPQILADRSMRRLILPAIRADYTAIETYRYLPEPGLTCSISVFIGESDPRVTSAEARAWQEHTTGPFSLRRFPGGHFYLNEQGASVVAALVQEMARYLAVPGPDGAL